LKVFDAPDLRGLLKIFRDREDAGETLARFLQEKLSVRNKLVVLAIPRGGVPIGCVLSKMLNAEFDLVVVRKIPIPWDPEAGFGAVTPDGEIYVDKKVISYLGLSNKMIKELVESVLEEIKRREKVFLGDRPRVALGGKNIILVDDGLATGYTMLAAVNYAKKEKPNRIFIAVPTASKHALDLLSRHVDAIYCLNVRSGVPYFAVADAYVNWRDLTDDDVLQFLKKYGYL